MSEIENFDYSTESGGVLKQQLDADEVVDRLAMNLRGSFLNNASGEYETPKGIKPLLNEKGISIIISVLKSKITNNNQYSNLTDTQIKSIRKTTIEDIWEILVLNRADYEIDEIKINIVLNLVDDSLLLFLSRTEKGGFLSFIKGLFNSNESYTESNDQEKKGLNIFGGGQ